MRYILLILVAISGLNSPTWAAEATPFHACAYQTEAASLITPDNQDAHPNLALYGCQGGLFLIDTEQQTPLLRVNPSSWLEAVTASQWNDDGTLSVTASFVTGIGPNAAEPFIWEFAISQDQEGVWSAVEVEPGADEYLVEADGMVEITRQAQLDALGLTACGDPYTIDVDFETERLIVKSVWLTSGSLKIKNVQVSQTRRAYFVTYDTEGPAIGTTDMRHAVIYLVLPRGTRYVSFEDPEFGAKRIKARTGILNRGNFNSAPIPGGH